MGVSYPQREESNNLESRCSLQPSSGLLEPHSQLEVTVNVRKEARCFLVDPGHTATRQVLW